MQKRQNKSKEQIAAEVKAIQLAQERRAFVKEKLFPVILANSESIDDAKILCEALAQTVRMAFNQKMVQMKFGDLGIKESMNNKSEHYGKMFAMVEVVEDRDIATALKILDEIPHAIDDQIRAEGKTRKLTELNLQFND